MFEPLLLLASLAHAAVLIGMLLFFCRRVHVPVREMPYIVVLLLWAGMVLGGHGAGALQGLGTLSIYAPASLLGVVLMIGLFHSVWSLPSAKPLLVPAKLEIARLQNPRLVKYLPRFLWATLILFGVISVVIGMGVYPDNADSMIYRLPRAVWYASHGNLLHPFVSPDNRLVYYPLDGVLLYIPFVLYNLPGTAHSIPSLISWALVVYTTYRFARELGGDKLIALFSAWIVGLTPSILAQATSTNDEILSAAALLSALYMGWRWIVTGRRAYFLMAGLAVSLSAGTKLHIVFLMPIVAIAVILGAWQVKKKPDLLRLWFRSIGWRTGLTTIALMVVMFAPFLFYNYASTGRFYFFDDFKKEVFNLSASLQVGAQNLLIYAGQMIFSPIADMNFWPVANDRQHFNNILNQILNPLIKPFINENPAYYHLSYRFVGITIPVSVRFVEFSLWSAFIWMLWPVQTILAYRQRSFALRPLLVLLAITPPFWLVFWSFSTLYMEGTATYFTFYVICAVPAAVMTFGLIRRPLLNELRWVVVALVALSNLLISTNMVMFSGFRALPDLYYSKTWPYDWLLTEQPIIDEIRNADRIRILLTHEKLPYFGYMHWHPAATYYTPFDTDDVKAIPDMQDVLQILSVSGLNMYGFMPLKIPGKVTPGPTYLGAVRAIGREAIFAVGHGVQLRHPEESDYILQQAKIEQKGPEEWDVILSDRPLGFSPDDQLTFEYELKSGDQVIFHREASRSPGLALKLKVSPHDYQMNLTTVVRSAWSGKELTRTTYQVGGPGMWLPEGGEY